MSRRFCSFVLAEDEIERGAVGELVAHVELHRRLLTRCPELAGARWTSGTVTNVEASATAWLSHTDRDPDAVTALVTAAFPELEDLIVEISA